MRTKSIWYIGVLAIGCVLMGGCTHQFDSQQDTPLENFEALWKIIDEKYCLFDDKQLDWDSVYDAYYHRFDTMQMKTVEDGYRMFDAMEEMLNSLEDGHVNLYTPFDVSVCKKWYEGYPKNFNDTLINKKYLAGARQASGLVYNRIDGDSIGYIYYGSFSDAFSLTNAIWVFNHFKDCRGIVLDVRNNGGGSMENAYKLASLFYSKDTLVGYWQHKTGPGHDELSEVEGMYLDESKGYWKRPVVVLCNRRSYSAANFFVSIMRYADNCLVLGGKSGGGGGMPLSYELPNGWIVRLSSIKMYDREMQSIEAGIRPHLLVNQVSRDKDDLIEEAVKLIHSAYK